MKVMVGITSTALILGIAGCGDSSQEPTTENWDNNQSSSGAYSGSSSDTSTTYSEDDIPPAPEDQNCADWEWDLDDGVYQCEDGGSSYYHHYYHGGRYYSSKPELYKSADYLNYKNSSAYKGRGTTVKNNGGTSTNSSAGSDGSTVKGSSGFGSGSKSFGG